MGEGIIKSGGDDGLYSVELTLHKERIDAAIAIIDAQIAKLDAKISEMETEIFILEMVIWAMPEGNEKEKKKKELKVLVDKKDLEKLKRAAYQKRKKYLNDNMPEDPTVSAWCGDLTEDLSGNVGTIEIPGERGIVQIQPGYEGGAAYDTTRDGQLQPAIANTPEGTFYNLAMLPGWQKWMPTYRHGIISNIDTDNDTCDVALDVVESSQQGLAVNQESNLSGIPIEYMSCNSSAFEDGDSVLVKFEGQEWSGAKVIGFVDKPKGCCSTVVFKSGEYYAAWNVAGKKVLLSPTNDIEEYKKFVPDPFCSGDSCKSVISYYDDRITIASSMESELTQTVESTILYITCDDIDYSEPVDTNITSTRIYSGHNEFGDSTGLYIGIIDWAWDPFCGPAGDPDWNGTSTGTYTEEWNYIYGYKLTCNNGNSDEKTAQINEVGNASWGTGPYDCLRTYTFTDPIGGASYEDVGCTEHPPPYSIEGDGFYSVDKEGDPTLGDIVTWIVRMLDDVYSVAATSDANIEGTTGANTLTSNEELSNMLQSLITLGEIQITYIRK